jgi:hypothetical protein
MMSRRLVGFLPRNPEMRFAYPVMMLPLALIVLMPGMAKADDAPLFHVADPTVACADEAATRSLTDPGEARRSNQAWVKSTFNAGRCVSVTAKSPWRFVTRDGDVVMMDYAGTVGPPGSYYFRVSQLTDANGYHPGDVAGAAPGTPAAAPATAGPSSSETALAPNAQPAPGATQATGGTPMGMPAPSGPSVAPTWGVTNVLLLLVALLLAAFGGYTIGRRIPRT